MIVTQSVQMVLGALLAVDALTGHATAWHVYVIAALTGRRSSSTRLRARA